MRAGLSAEHVVVVLADAEVPAFLAFAIRNLDTA
jgi:hypothetical protein